MPEVVGRSGNFGAVSRLVDAVRSRPVLYRVARRVAATRPARFAQARLMRPAISVIVPFYNVENYLAECLDSILGQSFAHFEVLLVDDGSPDGSRSIAERRPVPEGRPLGPIPERRPIGSVPPGNDNLGRPAAGRSFERAGNPPSRYS